MMKILRILMMLIFAGSLMLSSCSAPPDTSSLTEGHAYIYDRERLYDLAELEYVDPGFELDMLLQTDEQLYARVINDPTMFIITFTVMEYTIQTNIEDPAITDFIGCRLSTKLRVDKIHYMGKEVQLKEGEIYDFMHLGAWILEEDGKTVYTIHPRSHKIFEAFKYGQQYVMCGGRNYEEQHSYYALDSYYVSNWLGYNENTAPEDIWFLK